MAITTKTSIFDMAKFMGLALKITAITTTSTTTTVITLMVIITIMIIMIKVIMIITIIVITMIEGKRSPNKNSNFLNFSCSNYMTNNYRVGYTSLQEMCVRSKSRDGNSYPTGVKKIWQTHVVMSYLCYQKLRKIIWYI